MSLDLGEGLRKERGLRRGEEHGWGIEQGRCVESGRDTSGQRGESMCPACAGQFDP